MLDTTFDEPLQWNVIAGKDVAVGQVAGYHIQVAISPISYENNNGLNLVFAVGNEMGFSEQFGTISTPHAAKIIGAVTNAFKQRIADYDWDFLVFVAKANVEARMRLYSRIADRVSREMLLSHSQPIQRSDGSKYIVLYKPAMKQKIDVEQLPR
jgi:hypothetical protein